MSMTRDDIEQIVRDARANGAAPDLGGVDLRGLDLYGADLRGANLRGADLRETDLRETDLRETDLSWANLHGANLSWADLRGANWDGLRIDNLPSGQLTLTPTPKGWHLQVGCWDGTVDELETLALSDNEDDWPEAQEEQIAHRRPLLLAAIALCRAHIDANPTTIPELADRWGTKEENG